MISILRVISRKCILVVLKRLISSSIFHWEFSMLKRALALLVLLAACSVAPAAQLAITPDHADGCYAAGEPVTWTVTGGAAAALPYNVKEDGLTEVAKGTLHFEGGKARVTAKLGRPGTLLLTVKGDAKTNVLGGAAFAWPRIKPSAPAPADFDAFWQAKLKELAAVPASPVLEEIDSGSPQIQLWKITMDNIRGSKIHGYLARPKGDAPAPAMLQVQYAGVYPLQKGWVTGPAKEGWLALNIIAHDLPVDRDEAFYKQQNEGPLKDYLHQGGEDREKSYFLRMYLSCYRAVDYLAGRPDWNKKTLLVQGTSQGGMQSVIIAGLHPAVTAMTAEVPAGADQTGSLAGRAVGYPYWFKSEAGLKAAGYYDTVNFARNIHCPVLVGMGLADTTCPPSGVFAMLNQIPAPKRVVIMPDAGHKGAHKAYYAIKGTWWKAAHDGKPLPLK
jgi:cephalosporin-C deacetylase-like acetyl esterase